MKYNVSNWKTTASGLVTSGAGLVLAFQAGGVIMPRWLVIAAGFVMAGGFAAMGITGKDADVTGVGINARRPE